VITEKALDTSKNGASVRQQVERSPPGGEGRSRSLPYHIEYSPDAENHLRALTAMQQRIVLDAVDRQLAHQPTNETRNRKPMRPNPLAPWELRIGDLRV
jgi:mRNA-degrading endonuclease RelE of RelBE toxin-antitoxin system